MLFKNVKPSVDVEQEVCPERDEKKKEKKIFKSLPTKCNEIGKRISDEEAENNSRDSQSKGEANDAHVEWIKKVSDFFKSDSLNAGFSCI